MIIVSLWKKDAVHHKYEIKLQARGFSQRNVPQIIMHFVIVCHQNVLASIVEKSNWN